MQIHRQPSQASLRIAAFAEENNTKSQRADTSSEYFSQAVVLSPNNARIWDEWALHFLAIEEEPEKALPKLQKALELDPFYNWTYGLLGDYYSQKSENFSDSPAEEIQKALYLALEYYQLAIENSADSPEYLRSGYYAALAGVYIQLGDFGQAIFNYEKAIQTNPSREDGWKILEALSQLYLQRGDAESALFYAQNALNNAPEEQKARLEEWILLIKNQT